MPTVYDDIIVDAEFSALIPPLSAEERKQLEENIVEHGGARDPLVVWANGGKLTLLDGHNRYEICSRLDLPFDIHEMRFASRDDAADWMDRNQLGRRNLHPDAFTLLLGRRYNRAKKAEGGRSGRSFGVEKVTTPKTAERIAREHGVTEKTVRNAGKFAESVEKSKAIDPTIEAKVSSGKAPPRAAVVKAAALLEKSPERAREIIEGGKRIAEIEREEKRAAKEAAKREAAAMIEAATGVSVDERCRPGEVWILGDHVLYCGDTSKPEFIRIVGETVSGKASLAFADPPYGANIEGYDDSRFYWEHDYLETVADVVVVTPGIVSIFEFARITAMPYRWSMAAWITNGLARGAIGFGNWLFASVFSSGSVFRQAQDFAKVTISGAESDETDHPTRKPAEFVHWIVDTFTKPGEFVVDPFLGSGQTLVVCEASGRKCVGGELDPKFCSWIVSRWETMTGRKAEKR